MEAKRRSICSLMHHLSWEGHLGPGQRAGPPDCRASRVHSVLLISLPGWSWDVPDHLPAGGHLAQIVLYTQTGSYQIWNPRSPFL